MQEQLGPMDTIVDKFGEVVVHHWDAGCSSIAYSSGQAYDRCRSGLITSQEYAKMLVHRQDIRHAYDNELPLPEGAIVIAPTVQEVKDVAHMVTADLFFRAIRHARQAQASK